MLSGCQGVAKMLIMGFIMLLGVYLVAHPQVSDKTSEDRKILRHHFNGTRRVYEGWVETFLLVLLHFNPEINHNICSITIVTNNCMVSFFEIIFVI